MGKRLKNLSKTNVPVLLFATFLVVGGIVGAAFMSSKQPGSPLNAITKAVTKSPEPAVGQVASGTLWLANTDAVTVLKFDGKSERLPWDKFIEKYPSKSWPAQGSSAASGASVDFISPENASGTGGSYVSPDRRYVARPGLPKSDGASVIDVVQGKENPQPIILRDRRGRALTEAMLAGWLTPRSLAVTAVATSSRWIYSADLNGSFVPLAPLPENAIYLEARAGAVWYATAVLGQGIETPPQGPSDLHRVTPDGKDEVVAHDDLRVFQIAVPDAKGSLMYMTDDGQAFFTRIGDISSRQALGKRRPLLILDDGRFILRDGFNVLVYDPATMESKDLGALPEGEIKVFEGAP